jgi:hypothetical protein
MGLFQRLDSAATTCVALSPSNRGWSSDDALVLTPHLRLKSMNKKPSGTPGPSTLFFRLFASHAAILSLAFPLQAWAQQTQAIPPESNQTTATSLASVNPSRLPVDLPSGSLVDAPSAVFSHATATVDATGDSTAAGVVRPPPAKLTREEKILSESQRTTACEEGTLHGKPCRVSWSRVLGESFFFLAAQHGGNIAMDSDTRNQLTHGDFWAKYEYCVEHYRWSRWKMTTPSVSTTSAIP